jgi:hypothetical protein
LASAAAPSSPSSGYSIRSASPSRIIESLRLTSGAYDPQGEISEHHARGYKVSSSGSRVDATAWYGGIGAEGGIVSDAQDEAASWPHSCRGSGFDRPSSRP